MPGGPPSPGPSVFDYLEPTIFVRDWLASQGVTHADFCQRVTISEVSYLSRILSGQRPIGPDKARRWARAMALGPVETEFFDELVRSKELTHDRDRARARAVVERYRLLRTRFDLQDQALSILTDPGYAALLELLAGAPASGAPDALGRRLIPPRAPEAVVAMLTHLEALGLTRRVDCAWEAVGGVVATDAAASEPAAFLFHKAMLERAQDDVVTAAAPHCYGVTVAVSPALQEEIGRLLLDTALKVVAMCEAARGDPSTPADRVVHCHLHLFPLAGPPTPPVLTAKTVKTS